MFPKDIYSFVFPSYFCFVCLLM
eukprot:UN19376